MKKIAISKLISDKVNVKTFVSQNNSKGLPPATSEKSEYQKPYNNVENKERANPASESASPNKTTYISQPYFNKPDEANDTKIKPRTVGVEGEQYGHPFKDSIMPKRRILQAALEHIAGKYAPTKKQRQKIQKGRAKIYSRMWYKRNKGKHKRINRLNYKRKKRDPLFKRRRKFYNSPKYHHKYVRKNTGGVFYPSDRTQRWREMNKTSKQKSQSHSSYKKSRAYYMKNYRSIQRKAKKYRKKNKQKLKRYRERYQRNQAKHKRIGQKRYKPIPIKTASQRILFGLELPTGFQFGFVREFLLDSWEIVVFMEEMGNQKVNINNFLDHAIFARESDLETFFGILENFDGE